MSRFWSPVVHDLTPYVPGEQPKLANLVKLNTNENPYPPSPHVLAAIRAELGGDAGRLQLYPAPTGSQPTDACTLCARAGAPSPPPGAQRKAAPVRPRRANQGEAICASAAPKLPAPRRVRHEGIARDRAAGPGPGG